MTIHIYVEKALFSVYTHTQIIITTLILIGPDTSEIV